MPIALETAIMIAPDTGDVRIVRIVEGTDVGQVIDPYSLKMQLEGGLGSCGSDSAINEEMIPSRVSSISAGQ